MLSIIANTSNTIKTIVMVHNNNIKRNDTCDNYYFQLYVDVTQINNDNMLN